MWDFNVIPIRICIEPVFGMRQLCSICFNGSPPCLEKQPKSSFAHKALFDYSRYFSDLIPPPHLLCSRHTGLLPQGLCTCYSCLSAQFVFSPQPPFSQWDLSWLPGLVLPHFLPPFPVLSFSIAHTTLWHCMHLTDLICLFSHAAKT